jgi:hypothetical protein
MASSDRKSILARQIHPRAHTIRAPILVSVGSLDRVLRILWVFPKIGEDLHLAIGIDSESRDSMTKARPTRKRGLILELIREKLDEVSNF